jgi:hypothetical protein
MTKHRTATTANSTSLGHKDGEPFVIFIGLMFASFVTPNYCLYGFRISPILCLQIFSSIFMQNLSVMPAI